MQKHKQIQVTRNFEKGTVYYLLQDVQTVGCLFIKWATRVVNILFLAIVSSACFSNRFLTNYYYLSKTHWLKCFVVVRAILWLITDATLWLTLLTLQTMQKNEISKKVAKDSISTGSAFRNCHIDNSSETFDKLICNTLLAFTGTNMSCFQAYSFIVPMTQLFRIHFMILHVRRSMKTSIFLSQQENLQY